MVLGRTGGVSFVRSDSHTSVSGCRVSLSGVGTAAGRAGGLLAGGGHVALGRFDHRLAAT